MHMIHLANQNDPGERHLLTCQNTASRDADLFFFASSSGYWERSSYCQSGIHCLIHPCNTLWTYWPMLPTQCYLTVRATQTGLHGASWEVAFLHFWPATVFVFSQSPEEKGETEEGGDASKSEISLVYEIALKRNLSVNFEVSGKKQRTSHVQVCFSPLVSCQCHGK